MYGIFRSRGGHTWPLSPLRSLVTSKMTHKFWPCKYVMFGIKMIGSTRLINLRHFQTSRWLYWPLCPMRSAVTSKMTQKCWQFKYVMFGIKIIGSMRPIDLRHFQTSRWLHLTSMSTEVSSDLKDDPKVLAIQICHVWYQNDRLNETNWSKACSDFQVTTPKHDWLMISLYAYLKNK